LFNLFLGKYGYQIKPELNIVVNKTVRKAAVTRQGDKIGFTDNIGGREWLGI
jgi:uncharacterized protein (DUF342 family)